MAGLNVSTIQMFHSTSSLLWDFSTFTVAILVSISSVACDHLVSFDDMYMCDYLSYSKVCSDLRDPKTRLNEAAIAYFTPFRPMLGQRAAIDQVNVYQVQPPCVFSWWLSFCKNLSPFTSLSMAIKPSHGVPYNH